MTEHEIDLTTVRHLVIAGWTGRNTAALEAHIKELEAIGVPRPKTVPIFYRVSHALLTKDDSIEVMADASSGEVEFVLYAQPDGLWIGLGSDHTDRKAETMGVTLSKQMCAKPVSAKVWRYEDVRPHWDKLMLRAFIHVKGERRLYQEGPVTAMKAPEELISAYMNGKPLPVGWAMFFGTLAVHGGIVPADSFEMELDDPVLGRKLSHRYSIVSLPNEG
jgi:hypothetical protein